MRNEISVPRPAVQPSSSPRDYLRQLDTPRQMESGTDPPPLPMPDPVNTANLDRHSHTRSTESMDLKVVFWNMHGMSNIFNIFSLYDANTIICLCEMWVSEPALLMLKSSNIIFQPAIKQNLFGRASGGLIIISHNNLEVTRIYVSPTFIFARVNFLDNDFILRLIYFPPNDQFDIYISNLREALYKLFSFEGYKF